MKEYFSKSPIFDGDCYVADFTDATESRRGVEISTNPFDDFPQFHLKKAGSGNISYLAVNFEKYPTFIQGIENCECAFSAISDCRRPWLLMLETKYCTADNIEGYTYKAYSQMYSTFSKLTSLNLVKPDERNIYFVYSVPGHSDKAPFGAFTISQNATLEKMESEGIHLLGNNTMLIATPEYLFSPRLRI